MPALAPAQRLLVDSVQTTYETEVFFAFGKWEVRSDDLPALQEAVLRWQQAGAGAQIALAAHTDAVGSAASNLRLSEQRARAVAAALEAMGVERQSIALSFLGEAAPLADNDTEDGRQRNRRAHIQVRRMVPMGTISGRVTDQKSGSPVSAIIYLSSKTWRDSLRTDESGYFSARLPKDTIVRLEVFAPGYFFEATAQRVGAETPVTISLPPAVSGEKIALRNLLFYGNQAVLLPESESELPKVLRFMQLNPEAYVEIAGHINNPLKTPEQLDRWEWELSVNRAKLVYDYLLKNGISPDRMRYKGYGNKEMIYPNPNSSEEQQAQNRRVEIRIQ